MPRPTKGHRVPGSGRKPGTPNAFKQTRADKIAAEGVTPLEAMVTSYRYFMGLATREHQKGDKADPRRLARYLRQGAAIARDAAPYCHRRLASIVHTGPNNGPVQMIDLTGVDTTDLKAVQRVLSAVNPTTDES